MKKLVLFIIVLTFWGCDNNSTGGGNSENYESSIIGAWDMGGMVMIIFFLENKTGYVWETNNDGTYDCEECSGDATYTITQTKIIVNLPEDGDCDDAGARYEYTYSFSNDGNTIFISHYLSTFSGSESDLDPPGEWYRKEGLTHTQYCN